MGQKARLVLGLNSGTSADGVDAALCEITGSGEAMRVRVVGHLHRAYPAALRRRLLAVMAPAETTTQELCRLNTAVGEAFAATGQAALKKFGGRHVDLVGSHGQTICHLPPRSGGSRAGTRSTRVLRGEAAETGTLQIGDPAIMAARLGAPVVSHFRQADMAVGGQGAPLVPWTDWVLFRDARRTRVVQNIGGIANLTWLPCGHGAGRARPCSADDVLAFDTGPGNMLIDALVSHFSRGRQAYDRNGAMARRGRVMTDVLEHVMRHPYFALRPPKSCGREEFGAGYAAKLLRRFGRRGAERRAEDWIATATRVTAESIAGAYVRLNENHRKRGGSLEVVLCGGGARNRTLVEVLRAELCRRLPSAPRISTTHDYGISTQAKECVSFAMLATARMDDVSANLPVVTGARRRVVLGCVSGLAR